MILRGMITIFLGMIYYESVVIIVPRCQGMKIGRASLFPPMMVGIPHRRARRRRRPHHRRRRHKIRCGCLYIVPSLIRLICFSDGVTFETKNISSQIRLMDVSDCVLKS